MNKPLTKSQFKRLQLQWEKKLEKSGLKNIEYPNGMLKVYDSTFFRDKHGADEVTERSAYYTEAERLLQADHFLGARDKELWRLHCAGLDNTEISSKLKMGRKQVGRLVKYYAWFIKR